MKSLKVKVILGTARAPRQTELVAKFITEYLGDTADQAEVELVDVRNFLFGRTYEAWHEHEEVPEIACWKEIVDAADAFIIVTPEYNHGYPGELKLLLDAAYEEYVDKPVALAGVSSGRLGGARVVEQLKPVLLELGLVPLGQALYFPEVKSLFTDTEAMEEEARNQYEEQIDSMTESLLFNARQFQALRAKKEG